MKPKETNIQNVNFLILSLICIHFFPIEFFDKMTDVECVNRCVVGHTLSKIWGCQRPKLWIFILSPICPIIFLMKTFDLTLIIWLSLWCLQTFLIVRIIQWINTETKKLIRKRDRLYRKWRKKWKSWHQEKITPHSKIIKTELLAIYRGHCLHQRKLKGHLILWKSFGPISNTN